MRIVEQRENVSGRKNAADGFEDFFAAPMINQPIVDQRNAH